MSEATSAAQGPLLPGDARGLALLAGLVAAGLAAGGLGVVTSSGALESWYPTLEKPSWNPPSWLFGPVWTTLYVLVGWAGWRVADREGVRSQPMGWWGAQMVANAAWTPAFFGLRSPALGMAVIVVLLGLILGTIRSFLEVDRPAAYVLVPYAAWVAFASALNLAILLMN
jgi:tryptophan-rich sensory protein